MQNPPSEWLQFQKLLNIMSYYGVLRLLEPVCGAQQQSTASAGNTGAELCGEILDVLWKETGCDIAAVVHLL